MSEMDNLEWNKGYNQGRDDAHEHIEKLKAQVAALEAALVRLGNMTRFIEQPKRYMHEWYREDYIEEIRMRNQYAQSALKQKEKT